MSMLDYNEIALVGDLARLSSNSRVAFAASCAERMFPAYEKFCDQAGRGDRAALSEILESVWRHLFGDKMSTEQMSAQLKRCMELIPGEDDEPRVDAQACADDAASGAAYALRALQTGEPQEAAWAARRAYNAADYHVMHRLGIEGDSQLLAHPIVQAELLRQRRDLDDLLGVGHETADLFVRLRDRARAEGSMFFVYPS